MKGIRVLRSQGQRCGGGLTLKEGSCWQEVYRFREVAAQFTSEQLSAGLGLSPTVGSKELADESR